MPLDELPLFRTDVIDALREPLENGDITVARGEETVTLPARTMVVLASNPCPCGNNVTTTGHLCTCRPSEIRAYNRRVRGPIVDRIDITRALQPPAPGDGDALERRDTSEIVRGRVAEARMRQAARFGGEEWRLNGQAPSAALRDRWPLTAQAEETLVGAVVSGTMTRRGSVRVHRLAWTVADLAGVDRPGTDEVLTALALRSGDPLRHDVVEAVAAW